MKKNIINAKNITKSFSDNTSGKNKKEKKPVLQNISVEIKEGEFVSIMGESGSGKSTLMYALSGMDRIDSGQVFFEEKNIKKLNDAELADLRRSKMGFIFQQATFLKNLNILDNIILPAIRENKLNRKKIIDRSRKLMESVGISALTNRNITQLSGGQLQRAGICRALINSPSVVFGDEPTGALNSVSSQEIMNILTEINKSGTTLIIVTHDAKVSAVSERILFLKDGQIISEMHLPKYESSKLEDRFQAVTEKMIKLGI